MNNGYIFRKALQFYRGKDYDINEEIDEIQEKHASKKLNVQSNSAFWILRRLCSKACFKPFSIAGILSIASIMAGFNIVTIYMIKILEGSGSSIDPNIAPIIFGAMRFFVGSKDLSSKKFII